MATHGHDVADLVGRRKGNLVKGQIFTWCCDTQGSQNWRNIGIMSTVFQLRK